MCRSCPSSLVGPSIPCECLLILDADLCPGTATVHQSIAWSELKKCRSATVHILISVGVRVNPVFPCTRSRCCNPVSCTNGQVVCVRHVTLDVCDPVMVATVNHRYGLMNTRGTPENDLIRRIRAVGAAGAPLNSAIRLGIGDDAALFSPRRGYETV